MDSDLDGDGECSLASDCEVDDDFIADCADAYGFTVAQVTRFEAVHGTLTYASFGAFLREIGAGLEGDKRDVAPPGGAGALAGAGVGSGLAGSAVGGPPPPPPPAGGPFQPPS